MATLDVHTVENKKAGSVDLPAAVFEVAVKPDLFHAEVRRQLAERRAGTHSTKNRAGVSGGGAKPWRQKGTGRARQGTIRAPHHVGGGRVFGPHPRKYSVQVNKKLKTLARRSVLSSKAKTSDILVVENFTYDKPETKRIKKFLEKLKLNSSSVLILTEQNDSNMYLSARNVYKAEIRDSVTFSTYDVLRAEKIVIQAGAVKKINEVLG